MRSLRTAVIAGASTLLLFAACEQNPLKDDPAARLPEQSPMLIGGPSQGPQAGPLSTQAPTLLPGSGLPLVRESRPGQQMPAASLRRPGSHTHGLLSRNVTPQSFDQPSTGILWENLTTGQQAIWEMAGPVYTGEHVLFDVPPPWRIAGAGDFNGDGHDDIVWEHPGTGDRYIWFMEGADFVGSAFIGQVDLGWQIAAVGDMDGDGRADLIWQQVPPGSGRYIWLMDGAQLRESIFLGLVAPEWDIAGVGDFNDDRRGDIIWQNTATGDRYIWLMNVAQLIQSVALPRVDPAWDIAGAGNFFGGTTSDILWQHRPSGWRSLWAMDGPTWSGTGAVLPVVDPQWNMVGAFGRAPAPPPPPPPGPVEGIWSYNATVLGSVEGTTVTCELEGMVMFLGHDEEDRSLFGGFGSGGTWDCGTGPEEIEGILIVEGTFTAPNQVAFTVGTRPLWIMENTGTLVGNTMTGTVRLTVPMGPLTRTFDGSFAAERFTFGMSEAAPAARRLGLDASSARDISGIPTLPAGADVAASTRAAQQVLTRGIERAVAQARAREGLR